MGQGEATTLEVAGTKLHLVVRRRNVKNVNATLRGETLLVSAPPRIPSGELEHIVAELARRLMRRARARAVNSEADLAERARRIAARFPAPPEVREVRFSTRQRTRWGCCNAATGTILLNAALAHMPAWVLDTVIAHELVHLIHCGHGPAFKALLARVSPDHERGTAFLAGAGWLASRWHTIPAADREQLGGVVGDGLDAAPDSSAEARA